MSFVNKWLKESSTKKDEQDSSSLKRRSQSPLKKKVKPSLSQEEISQTLATNQSISKLIVVINEDSTSDPDPTKSDVIVSYSDVPSCWTVEQAKTFKIANNWLIIKKQALGCSICKTIKHLGIYSEKNLRLSKPWRDCLIKSCGRSRVTEQSSLRKKIHEHKKSRAHRKAEEIIRQSKSKEKEIVSNLENINKTHQQTTERVFRTVYKIIKNQRPFVDLPTDIDLQKLNGINMGKILHSDKTCAQIATHIATEMRKTVCEEIITSKNKIAILVDECTTLSKNTTLLIAIKTFFGDYPGHAYVFYLDLIELSNTSAKTIIVELLKCLNEHGFNQDFLNECLISFACDGASVMLGKNSGVATTLRELYPNLLFWHCANHRLELTVNDTIKEVTGINNFKIFIEKLYTLYNKSPKNQNELREAAASLDIQLLKIGKIFPVTWIASSYQTVNAVINNYPSLCEHFHRASEDDDKDDLEKKKYKSLYYLVKSEEFVLNLNTMADALEKMADLSHNLERRNMTVVDADKAVINTIKVLDSMASDPGKKLSTTLTDLKQSNTYKGIVLHKNNSIKSINASQFYRSLANNMRSNLITTVSSHEENQTENISIYNNLIQSVKLLHHKVKDLQLENIRYGEDQIRQLSHQFHLSNNETNIISAFRIFKSSDEDDEIPEDLKPLLKAIATIPISTSECERNFRSLNEIVSQLRTSLDIATISALMFINIVGPPLNEFQPSKYVRSWLAKGYHFADDVASGMKEARVENTYDHLWDLL